MSPSSTTSSEIAAREDSDLFPHDAEALLRGPLRKTTALIVVATFLTVVVGTGIVDGFFPLPAPKVIGKEKQVIEKRRESARFADGSLARLIEYDLRTRSRVRSVALPYYTALLYQYLREAETTAVLGREGWIFLRDRIDVDAGDEERRVILSARILRAVARRLRQAGSELIVLPIPRKSVVYREMLPRGEDPRPHLYGELLRELSENGVRAVDLMTPYRARRKEVLFRKVDSHWNSLGMTIAAEALAKEMGASLPPDRRTNEVKSLGLQRDPGDLLRLIGITKGSRAAALIDWPEYPRLRLFDRKGKLLPPSTNPSLPVAAAASGTSFTHNSFFPDFVRNATGQRIWFGAWPAIGPVEPFRRTLHSFRGHPLPKTLIWEVPAHNLFCRKRPLNDVGRLFAEISGGRWATLSSFGIEVPLSKSSDLNPGVHVAAKKTLRAHVGRGAIIFRGDGALWVRLKGRVTGGDAVVTTDTTHYRLYSRWHPDSPELILPFVGPEPISDSAHITLTGTKEDVEIDVTQLEFVMDATRIPGIRMNLDSIESDPDGYRQSVSFAQPHTAARGEVLAFQLDVEGAFSRTLRVEAYGPWGETELLNIGKITPRGAVLVDLSPWTGKVVAGLRLIGRGKPPRRLVRDGSPVLIEVR